MSGDDQVAPAPAASDHPDEPRHARRSFLRELPVVVITALVLAVLIKTFLIQVFSIPSVSMEPTLAPGDRILVCRICTAMSGVERGQVIVFSDPDPGTAPGRGIVGGVVHWLGEGIGVASPEDEDFVKRVVGLPGDLIELHAGQLFVNGAPVEEPYLDPDVDTSEFDGMTVPDGMLFVLGDNRMESGDSRFPPPRGVGLVPQDVVIGTVVLRIWPPSRVGAL
jgi:signal peptidase I